MIHDIMTTLADGTTNDSEALHLGVRILEWLQRHLGWEGETLWSQFGVVVGHESGAGKLARAWYPGCSYMAGMDHQGRGCAALRLPGGSAPIVATADNPANALLLTCFRAYDLCQQREGLADQNAQAVA